MIIIPIFRKSSKNKNKKNRKKENNKLEKKYIYIFIILYIFIINLYKGRDLPKKIHKYTMFLIVYFYYENKYLKYNIKKKVNNFFFFLKKRGLIMQYLNGVKILKVVSTVTPIPWIRHITS